MTQVFSNNAASSIVIDLDLATTSIDVSSGSGLLFSGLLGGGDYELITIHTPDYSSWEVVKAVSRTLDTFTVERGVEGVQQTWTSGALFTANVTAKGLNDLAEGNTTALALATSASSDASEALVAANDAKASAAGPDFCSFEVTANRVDVDEPTEGYYITDLVSNNQMTLRYYDASADTPTPLPSFGWTLESWQKVMVCKNGLVQNYTNLPLEDIIDSATYDGYFQILGHMFLRFWPALIIGDKVQIYAQRASWAVDGQENTYNDMYANTGVIYSLIAAGYDLDGAANIAYTHQFTWAVHTYETMPTPWYDMQQAGPHGTGAISDGVLNIHFFGGAGGSTYTGKLKFNPISAMVLTDTGAGTIYGVSYTDKTYAWLCGCGTATTDNVIKKFTIAGETYAVIAATVDGSVTDRIHGFCTGTNGYTFNQYDSGGASGGYFQNLTCATDSITTEGYLGLNIGNASVSAYFRSGHAFIWKGYSTTVGIMRWDIATDTIVQNYRATKPKDSTNAHDVICDGEHYALSMSGALLVDGTEAIVTRKTRVMDGATKKNRVENPAGAATDYWVNC